MARFRRSSASPSPLKPGSSRAGSPCPTAPARGAPLSPGRSPATPGTATGSRLPQPPPQKACRKRRGRSIAASTCTCNPRRQKRLRDPNEATPLLSPRPGPPARVGTHCSMEAEVSSCCCSRLFSCLSPSVSKSSRSTSSLPRLLLTLLSRGSAQGTPAQRQGSQNAAPPPLPGPAVTLPGPLTSAWPRLSPPPRDYNSRQPPRAAVAAGGGRARAGIAGNCSAGGPSAAWRRGAMAEPRSPGPEQGKSADSNKVCDVLWSGGSSLLFRRIIMYGRLGGGEKK